MVMPTFRGGIHPKYDGKALSMNTPIVELPVLGEMVYPVSQHIGAPSKPIVKVGDEVLVGQKIAEAASFISANILSSVSGKVKKIEKRRVINGNLVDSIIVENDEQYNTVEGFGEFRDYTKLSREEILDIIKEAGIVGLGGAGFPTHVKLAPKNKDEIDYILINAAECEPYLTSDYRMILERPEDIINGIKIVLSLFDNAKAVIGIEDNKPEAVDILTKLCEKENKIKVCPLKTKYPQGGERSIIKAITLREINHKMLPADVGCVVQNVSTIIAISDAVSYNKPLVEKVMTLTGDAMSVPANYRVRLGCSHKAVLEAAGGFSKEPTKIVSGGPMMGIAMFTLDIPVTKTAASILAMTIDDVSNQAETPCIKCDRCVDVCPSFITPVIMMDYALRLDKEGFEKVKGMECIECGSCSYVCPAKRPLTQAFKLMRQHILADRRMAAEAAKEGNK